MTLFSRTVGHQESSAPTELRRSTVVLMVIAVFLYWMALYLYAPTLPTYVKSKTETLAMVGVVLSMYGLWQAVVRLPLGIVADWLGRRRPFIIAGFVLAGLGAYLMGTANGVNGLLVGRAVTGLAAGTWVPLVALFSTYFRPEEAVKASSLLTFVGSAARVLATAVTGTLNDLGGYPLAFFAAAGAASLAILVTLPTREAVGPRKQPSLRSIGAVISRRDVLVPSLLSMVSMYANWAATFGFVPILAKSLGATDITLSALLSLSTLLLTIGNLMAASIASRMSARRMYYLGFGLVTAGVAGAAVAPSLGALFGAQLAIGLGQGINYPVLMGMSIRHVDAGERTTATGLHQSVYAIGMFAGPAASGIIADAIGIRPMFGVTAAVCLAIGVVGSRWLVHGRQGH